MEKSCASAVRTNRNGPLDTLGLDLGYGSLRAVLRPVSVGVFLPAEGRAGVKQRTDQPTKPVIFIRAEGFYPIFVYEDEDLSRHAELNPGTLRIEDLHGNILWRPQ